MSDQDVRRQSAVFADTTNRLRATTDLPDDVIERRALEAVDHSVYGHDAKKDSKGNFIPQGVGAPGHETSNHYASIRRYEGEEAWRRAVAELYRRDPKRAAALNLPRPSAT